jgi:hypothetical protein
MRKTIAQRVKLWEKSPGYVKAQRKKATEVKREKRGRKTAGAKA